MENVMYTEKQYIKFISYLREEKTMRWEKLLSKERLGGSLTPSYKEKKYYRNEFKKDYRRIVSSASFRRLQDKTQVFPLDASDFVRTRLTHSLEVASIAKEFGEMTESFLKNEGIVPEGSDELEGLCDVLTCAGLLHDIGNPPFGHFGETVIGDWYKNNLDKFSFCGEKLSKIFTEDSPEYKDLCGFEGNAQAFRLLTKLHFVDSDYGINLTSAVLSSIVKYPCSSKESNSNHKNIKYHKMGYFQGDWEYFEKVAGNTGTLVEGEYVRHPLTFLLEASDDIAYATADLEDGFKKRKFTLDELVSFFDKKYEEYEPDMTPYQKEKTKELFQELKNYREDNNYKCEKHNKDIDLYAMQNWIMYVQNWLIYCAFWSFTENYDEIMNGSYGEELLTGTNQEYGIRILKDAMAEYIFPDAQILKLELAADSILSALLERFVHAVLYYDYQCDESLPEEEKKKRKPGKGDRKLITLLSENYLENYKMEVKGIRDEKKKLYYRLLLVNDFISGMTDSYAKSLYQELIGIY